MIQTIIMHRPYPSRAAASAWLQAAGWQEQADGTYSHGLTIAHLVDEPEGACHVELVYGTALADCMAAIAGAAMALEISTSDRHQRATAARAGRWAVS